MITTLAAAALFASEPTATRGLLKHREHNGIGYDTGYTTAELFLCPAWKNNFMPFLDMRGHVFDSNDFASNIGIGLRYNWSHWTVGGNFYYDFREAQNINPHQLGGGLEFLSRYFDIRANGYAPIASTKAELNPTFKKFQGNSAIFARHLRAALPAVDAEIGVPLGSRCEIVNWYAALGPYYLFEKNVNGYNLGGAVGGKGRIVLDLISRFNLGFDTTYDKIFKWTFQGTAGISMPLGLRKKVLRSKSFLCEARNQLPYRSEIIPVEKKNKRTAIDNIIFVNNTSSSNGTFESPFPTTAQAMAASKPGDTIYIFPGDGTTTGYDTTITMLENQTIQGSAADLDLGGGFIVPSQTPGSYPMLTSASNTITVAANATISGLDITAATNGVVDDDPTIPVGGTINIISSRIHDCAADGMVLGNSSNSVNYRILSNQCFDNATSDVSTDLLGLVSNTVNMVFADNLNTRSGATSISYFAEGDTSFNVAAVRNKITGPGARGISFTSSDSSHGTCIASRNKISGATNSIGLVTNQTADMQACLTNNSLGNKSGGDNGIIAIITQANSSLKALIASNHLFNSPNNMIDLQIQDSSSTRFHICNNTLSGTTTQGVILITPINSNADLTSNLIIDYNLFYDNQTSNIPISAATDGTYNLIISNNYITDTTALGLLLPIGGTANASIDILNNTIFTSATNAIDINPAGSSSMCATLFGNQAPLNEIEFQNTANLRLESPTPGSSTGLAETNTFKAFNPPTGSFYVAPGTCD